MPDSIIGYSTTTTTITTTTTTTTTSTLLDIRFIYSLTWPMHFQYMYIATTTSCSRCMGGMGSRNVSRGYHLTCTC